MTSLSPLAMQHRGRISTWKDDKGFGFITPDDKSEKVFVHASAFVNRQRRPLEKNFVIYQLVTDDKGRPQASNVKFAGDKTRVATGPSSLPPIFAICFTIFLMASVLLDWLPTAILYLYLGASVATFLTYAWDKSAAMHHGWRIPESTLHLLGLVGGWPGALVAQRWLRHKSAKTSFQTTYWATIVINCAALAWLCTDDGSRVLMTLL